MQFLKHVDDAVLTVSDLHLSAGEYLPDGSANVLEDFDRDHEFARMLTVFQEKYAHAQVRHLHLLGDIFDPLVIPEENRFDAPPTETTCAKQMAVIIKGHPVFFNALAQFGAAPGNSITLFIGNHDFFLEWDAVQKSIREALGNLDEEKFAFAYQKIHKGVLYTHGNFEPNNAVEESERYLFPEDQKDAKEPILNYPYGNYLHSALVPPLRLKHPYVGRLSRHGYILKEAATRNFSFAAQAFALVVKSFFYHRFKAIWDIRRKSGFVTTLKIAWWVFFRTPQEAYAESMIRRHPHLEAVVCGHDHMAREKVLSRGMFYNTGTWAKLYHVTWHDEPKASWGAKLITKLMSSVTHVWHKPEFIRDQRLPAVIAEHDKEHALLRLVHFNAQKGEFEVLPSKHSTV